MLRTFKFFQKNKLKKNTSKKVVSFFWEHSPDFRIIAAETGYLTKDQLESMRRVFVRATARKAFVRIGSFSFYPLVSLGKNARMGKGKGKIKNDLFFCKVNKGQVICSVWNLTIVNRKRYKNSKNVLVQGAAKLPLKCTII